METRAKIGLGGAKACPKASEPKNQSTEQLRLLAKVKTGPAVQLRCVTDTSRSPQRDFPTSFSLFPTSRLPDPGPSAPGGCSPTASHPRPPSSHSRSQPPPGRTHLRAQPQPLHLFRHPQPQKLLGKVAATSPLASPPGPPLLPLPAPDPASATAVAARALGSQSVSEGQSPSLPGLGGGTFSHTRPSPPRLFSLPAPPPAQDCSLSQAVQLPQVSINV
jgi:hypothetical protein